MNPTLLKRLFWIMLVFTLATLAALGRIDEGLRNQTSPLGIVSFELCAYGDACDAVLQAWGPLARQMAVLSLGLDYLFMVLYPATIFIGLLLVSARVPARLRGFTVGTGWWAWVAGIADAVENYFLTQMVLTQSVQALAWPATLAATLKFVVLVHSLLWLLLAYGVWGRSKMHPPSA